MANQLNKSTGSTPSEQYLAGLCENTFLKLWSYPNVFRDQGRKNGGDGKELCDLLIVCGDDVIIFSDKSCEMTDSGNSNLDWSRWYRKAIDKSADQVFGAERWIRKYPDKFFLDPQCTYPLPISLPAPENLRVHRIVVALGAKSRCRKELKGSGSLWLKPVFYT